MLANIWSAGPSLRNSRIATISCAVIAAFAALPAVAAAAPKGAFASDYQSGMLDQFTFGSGQTLSANGSATSGSTPWFEAVTPNGKYLYVANYGSSTVSQYSISSSGTLTPLSPASVATGSLPVQVAVSPDGHNAYVANYLGSVSVFDIASNGSLTSAGTVSGLSEPGSVAVSPDGSSVYVGDSSYAEIFEYNRASNGTLTPKSTPSISAADAGFPDLAMTPNGKYLYESSDDSDIYEYSVGSGGELSYLASISSGGANYSIIVSPNGLNAYTSSGANYNVYQYSIGSNGELTALTPASVATDGYGLPWMTADGGSFYVPDYSDSVYQYNVSSTGLLTPKSPATATFAGAEKLWGFIIPPDQGPVAVFSAKAGKAGKATKFNASGSSDSDGTVAGYHWSFGDGSSVTTTSATVSHTYKHTGKHKVTLTVTDDSGCSTTQVFTGQTAYCNGTSAAKISHTVKIAAAKKPLKLSVSPKSAKAAQTTCYAFKATSKGHGVKKVTVTLAGHTAKTSGSGKATLCLTLSKGTYHARASKDGYTVADARITVSAASPVFTG